MKDYRVRAARCDRAASESDIDAILRDVTADLSESWERIGRADKVLIKTNMVWPPERIEYFDGRRRELVDDAVMRSILRLIRGRTDAELVVIDTMVASAAARPEPPLNFQPLLDEFGVRFIDANYPPFETVHVPGGGRMFDRYQLHAEIADADEMISVAKMKSHAFMGLTLTTKNLFGLPPIPPHGRTRSYFHHIIRLPYVLADLATIMRPCLNIVDGLVGQSGREWGGEARAPELLLAGDHPIATDACGAYLMGHDPASDWPTPPFRRDRNHLLVAAEGGLGTIDLDHIDFQTEIQPPVAAFDSEETDPFPTVRSWRRTTCEQGLFYREHAAELFEGYAGQFIYLQDGEVVWHGVEPQKLGSRRSLSGTKRDRALFLKLVDPHEREGEKFQVYEENLRLIRDRTADQPDGSMRSHAR